MRRRRVILVVALAAALIAGTLAGATAAQPAGSWRTHRSPAKFTIAAPSTWIDVTRLTPSVLSRLRQNPALAGYLAAIQRTHAIKLILADAGPLTVANHYAITCNVAQVPTFGDLRLARDATVAELKATGLVRGAVHSGYVALPAGRAVELRYQEQVSATSPSVLLDQFILVRDGLATAISYATLPKLARVERPVFLRSARSLRFTA
jgi:hypothetical protein